MTQPVPDEVPEQTDNRERDVDPVQDVSQDPNVDYSSDEL